MEQLGADLVDFERYVRQIRSGSVPKRDIRAERPIAAAVPSEPASAAQLDLMRKAMLGFAGVLTLLWFCLLAWGALRLIGTLLF
jgi:hypothetical protein